MPRGPIFTNSSWFLERYENFRMDSRKMIENYNKEKNLDSTDPVLNDTLKEVHNHFRTDSSKWGGSDCCLNHGMQYKDMGH